MLLYRTNDKKYKYLLQNVFYTNDLYLLKNIALNYQLHIN